MGQVLLNSCLADCRFQVRTLRLLGGGTIVNDEQLDIVTLSIVDRGELIRGKQVVDSTIDVGADELAHPELPIVCSRADASQLRSHLHRKLVRPVAWSSREIHVVESATSTPPSHEVTRQLETQIGVCNCSIVVVSIYG